MKNQTTRSFNGCLIFQKGRRMELIKKRYNSMTLYLTLNCNLECTYCFCGKKYKENMTKETAEQAMDFFNDNCTDKANITFFGGEPLMRMDLIKDIIELNKIKYNNKFKFSITTNGLNLVPNNFKYLVDNNVNILLSLDGDKESQDKNRPQKDGKGSWDIIMKNLEKCEIRLPLRLTISKETLSNLSNNIIKLHKKGFDSITFYPASGVEWKGKDFEIFDSHIHEITKYMYECYSSDKVLKNHWIDKSIQWYIINKSNSCNLGVFQFSVTPNGNIYPCNHTNFEDKLFLLGDINNGIDNDKVKWINKQINISDPECSECSFINRCKYCNMNMYEETKELWKIPDWFCTMNQIVIKHSDDLASKLYKEKNTCFMKRFYGKDIYD